MNRNKKQKTGKAVLSLVQWGQESNNQHFLLKSFTSAPGATGFKSLPGLKDFKIRFKKVQVSDGALNVLKMLVPQSGSSDPIPQDGGKWREMWSPQHLGRWAQQ